MSNWECIRSVLPFLYIRTFFNFEKKIFQEAAEAAFALKNMEALTALELKANKNISLLETIAAYKQKLESPR